MSYTLAQALALLDTPDYSGLDGLRRLAAETSAIPTGGAPNASLLLYAGNVGDYQAWQVATTLSASSVDATGAKQLVTIGDTAVGGLLKNNLFLERLDAACQAKGIQVSEVLSGETIVNGEKVRINNSSLWDVASRNLASEYPGNIVTIAENASPTSVFVQSEIEAALGGKAASINGVPREDLSALRAALVGEGMAGADVECVMH